MEADVPIYATTAITSEMLTALLRVPAAFEEVSAGIGTSKKSHGLSGSRLPPSLRSAPASRLSAHPSASRSRDDASVVTVRQAENSEVFPCGSLAVAVTTE